jgi:predicted dehydrogenase
VPGGDGWGRDDRDGVLIHPDAGGEDGEQVPTLLGDHRAYYEGVRDAILGNEANPVPVAEAIAVVRMLELAVESAAARREVPV